MTADRDAFRLAVRDDPEADAPRLVFADWLDEQDTDDDRAWAAYIRRAIDLERLPRTDPRYLDVRRRLDRFRPPECVAADVPTALRRYVQYSRGFADGVLFSSFLPTAALRAVADCASPLHRLALTNLNEPATLAESPGLSRFRDIDLTGCQLRGGPFGTLARSRHFGPVTRLIADESFITDTELQIIAVGRAFAGLRELSLARCFGDADWSTLASPNLASLERLRLGTITEAICVTAIAHSPHLARLRSLGPVPLHRDWVSAVVAGSLPALAELHVSSSRGEGALLGLLLNSPRFASLSALNVETAVPPEVWASVPTDPGPPGLTLRCRVWPRESTIALMRSPAIGRCVELDLSGTPITPADIAALAASPYCRHLRILSLGRVAPGGATLPAETARALAASPHLAGLTALSLGPFGLDDVGLSALAGAAFAPGLRALAWSGGPVSERALTRLAAGSFFPRLIAAKPCRALPRSLADMLASQFPAPCFDW